MDADTRKAMGTNASKPLNMPEALLVEEGPSGSPVAVKLKQRHTIIAIEDCWRIDDEWWRGWYFARTLSTSVGTNRNIKWG